MTSSDTGRLHSAFQAFFIAYINRHHIRLEAEATGFDTQPFNKLLSKTELWLKAELKSADNFLRFFEAYADWRDEVHAGDTLSGNIFELTCSALYVAADLLLHGDNDDMPVLLNMVDELHSLMTELGGDGEGLSQYWQSLQQELTGHQSQIHARPLPMNVFKWLQQQEVSLFGLTN